VAPIDSMKCYLRRQSRFRIQPQRVAREVEKVTLKLDSSSARVSADSSLVEEATAVGDDDPISNTNLSTERH